MMETLAELAKNLSLDLEVNALLNTAVPMIKLGQDVLSVNQDSTYKTIDV